MKLFKNLEEGASSWWRLLLWILSFMFGGRCKELYQVEIKGRRPRILRCKRLHGHGGWHEAEGVKWEKWQTEL